MSKHRAAVLAFGVCLVALLATGCIGIKRGGTRPGHKLYETFFVGEEGTQYFIKPLAFDSENGEATLDITFRYKTEIRDSATINISFVDDKIHKSADSIVLRTGTNRIELHAGKLLFNDKVKGGYASRFTTKALLADIVSLFKQDDWTVSLYSAGSAHHFRAGNKTRKKISKLQENVFALF